MTIDDFFPVIQKTCLLVYHCKVVLTRWDPRDHSLVISQIVSQEPGKGNATKCMNYLIDTLERYGVKRIDIIACPLGGMGPKERQKGVIHLTHWYRKFGFEMIHYSKCGDYIANAEMELNLLPSKLVGMNSMDINYLKSPMERSIHTTNDKGLPSKLVIDFPACYPITNDKGGI